MGSVLPRLRQKCRIRDRSSTSASARRVERKIFGGELCRLRLAGPAKTPLAGMHSVWPENHPRNVTLGAFVLLLTHPVSRIRNPYLA